MDPVAGFEAGALGEAPADRRGTIAALAIAALIATNLGWTMWALSARDDAANTQASASRDVARAPSDAPSLLLTTDPPSAEVMDPSAQPPTPLGQTPLTIDLSSTATRVVLKRDGHVPVTLSIEPGQPQSTFQITLPEVP